MGLQSIFSNPMVSMGTVSRCRSVAFDAQCKRALNVSCRPAGSVRDRHLPVHRAHHPLHPEPSARRSLDRNQVLHHPGVGPTPRGQGN